MDPGTHVGTRQGRGRARCAWNGVHPRARRPRRIETVARITSPSVPLPTRAPFAKISVDSFGFCHRCIQLTAPILHSRCGPLTPPAYADSKALIQLVLAPHPLLLYPQPQNKTDKKGILFSSGLSVFFLLLLLLFSFFSHLSCCADTSMRVEGVSLKLGQTPRSLSWD